MCARFEGNEGTCVDDEVFKGAGDDTGGAAAEGVGGGGGNGLEDRTFDSAAPEERPSSCINKAIVNEHV